jgi:hypothetical protein
MDDQRSLLLQEWSITPTERGKFAEIFEKADDDKDGFVTGPQARQLFSRSGLDMEDLGRIWSAALPAEHTHTHDTHTTRTTRTTQHDTRRTRRHTTRRGATFDACDGPILT